MSTKEQSLLFLNGQIKRTNNSKSAVSSFEDSALFGCVRLMIITRYDKLFIQEVTIMPTTVKNRVLYILKYLWETSDETHPVSTNDIIHYLAQIGIDAGRKTIAGDIEQLQECGSDIVCNKSRQNL